MKKMEKISKEELIYLAGFIDGDGSIIARLIYHKDYDPKNKYQISLTLQITQSTRRRWRLEQLQDQIGEGTIRDRDSGVSDYMLVGPLSVSTFLKLIKPYLKLKTKQANLAIRIAEQLPDTKSNIVLFCKLSQYVDRIAAENDSKTRTQTSKDVIDYITGTGLLTEQEQAEINLIVPVETEE